MKWNWGEEQVSLGVSNCCLSRIFLPFFLLSSQNKSGFACIMPQLPLCLWYRHFLSVCASSGVHSCTCKSSSFTCAELHNVTSSRTVPVLCCWDIRQSARLLQLPTNHHHLALLFRASVIGIHWHPRVLLTFCKSLFLQLFSHLPPLFPLDKYVWFFLPSCHLCSFLLSSIDVCALCVCPRVLRCLWQMPYIEHDCSIHLCSVSKQYTIQVTTPGKPAKDTRAISIIAKTVPEFLTFTENICFSSMHDTSFFFLRHTNQLFGDLDTMF